MTFILSRHGKSSHNHHNIFAGSKIFSKLTPQGRINTIAFAKKIADLYHFEIIICSKLTRSYQTALIHQKIQYHKYKIKPKIIKTELLNEVDIGQISGMKPKEAIKKYPHDYNKIQSNDINDWSFTNGENQNTLNKRFTSFKKYLNQFLPKNTLIVGHAMFNKIIINKTSNINQEKEFDHNYYLEIKIND